MGTAPSLTSQAATRVAIQALIRGDQDAGRGVKAADERRVSPALLPPCQLPWASGLLRGRVPSPLRGPWTTCRSLTGFFQRPGLSAGLAGGCSAPWSRRGPRGPCVLRLGATRKPMVPSATRPWATCPCSKDPEPEPHLPSTQPQGLPRSQPPDSLAPLPGHTHVPGSLSGSRQGSQPASVTSCNKVASICSLSDHLSFSVRDFLEVHHHPFPGALLLWKTPTPCLVQSPPEAMWAVLSLQVTKTAWGLPGGQLPLPQCPGASG